MLLRAVAVLQIQISGNTDPKTIPNVPQEEVTENYLPDEEEAAEALEGAQRLRRPEIPYFALHRRNFLPLFYGVSEIFLKPRKTPLKFLL